MNATFTLRLKAFNRALAVLDLPEHVAIWKDQAPLIFTAKKSEAAVMTAALAEAAKKLEAESGGLTDEKQREETELEEAAFILSQALLLWLRDQNQESEAAEVAFSKSAWEDLRETQLLAKSQRVIDLVTGVTNGTRAEAAAAYGITAEELMKLKKERMDFALIVSEPGVAQSLRKALNKSLRPAFALVEMKFKELDSLILQYGKTPVGKAMIHTWSDARTQKGLNAAKDPKKPGAPAKPA